MARPLKRIPGTVLTKTGRFSPRHGTALARQTLPVVDPETGERYPTRKLMVAAQKMRHTRMLTDFAGMVADKTLGQEPWERLPFEDDVHYHRFRNYLTMQPQDGRYNRTTGEAITEGRLDIGGPRSYARLANLLSCPVARLKSQSQKYHWRLRAECYDREVHRQEDEAFIEQKRAAMHRQARLGAALQEGAFKGLAALVAAPGELSAGDVVRMADIGVKIERLAHDKSTSNTAEQKEVRFVWDGPKPKWVEHDEAVVEAHQIEVTP